MTRKLVILDSEPKPAPGTCAAQMDQKLAAEGWVRRHTADAQRAGESIELYRSLGFEVLTRTLTPTDYDPICRDCVMSACPTLVVIYTRKKPHSDDASDDRTDL